jgi:hypothetical protein
MVSQIVAAICLGIIVNGADASGSPSDGKGPKERVKHMIAFLNGEKSIDDDEGHILAELPRLAPQDPDAHKATIRYFEERAAQLKGMPMFFPARFLSQYGPGFDDAMMTSLAKTKYAELGRLWFVTLALMGRKAEKQVEPLTQYIQHQDAPAYTMQARVALAMIGKPSPESIKIIEKEVREQTVAGRAAVEMAALVGFGDWASAATITEVKKWITDASEEDRCWAAMALAISSFRDESLQRDINKLMEETMKRPETSGRICYAYALSLMDPDNAERYWRVIFHKLGFEYNHTDGMVIVYVIVSIPVKQLPVIIQVCKDNDEYRKSSPIDYADFLELLELYKEMEDALPEKGKTK